MQAPARLSDRSSPSLEEALDALGIADRAPFVDGDATAGTETELHAAVRGSALAVDLPREVRDSATVHDLRRRVARGDASPRILSDIERFLDQNEDEVWDHSWVVVRLSRLHEATRRRFEADLRRDLDDPDSAFRTDAARFRVQRYGEACARIPVSYVLRLALLDVSARWGDSARSRLATNLADHFLNDNSSPETHSFHVVPLERGVGGRDVADEMAVRYLTSQLLAAWANEAWETRDDGQEVLTYFASHTPERQRVLNRAVPDAFYRELFMSPCLSGWRHGEDKHRYMHLCHEVMSRSHLNALPRLRDAGLLGRNLVVLPDTSTTALQNNGTHISLGSRRMTAARKSGRATHAHEKVVTDLVIKVSEVFLPLFVGLYASDPVRLEFADFHPERLLGYLVHELSGSDLRRLWWRWRHKAGIGRLGRSWTPFGPPQWDAALAKALRLPGDCVLDYRLLDYLTALPSTARHGAFDGTVGNQDRLKRELAELGIFDEHMSFYAPIKNREQARIGFSGVEWRIWSTFPSFSRDAGPAVMLQWLVTAYAFELVRSGQITHADIPDDPSSESERRLLMFSAAIGLRTFTVRRSSRNRWMLKLLERTPGVRRSKRYRNDWKVELDAFRATLLRTLRHDTPHLVEALGAGEALRDASARIAESGSAAARHCRDICERVGASTPLAVDAARFNVAAERHARVEARQRHVEEALDAVDRLSARHSGAVEPRGWQSVRAGLERTLVRGRPRLEDIERGLQAVIQLEAAARATAEPDTAAEIAS